VASFCFKIYSAILTFKEIWHPMGNPKYLTDLLEAGQYKWYSSPHSKGLEELPLDLCQLILALEAIANKSIGVLVLLR